MNNWRRHYRKDGEPLCGQPIRHHLSFTNVVEHVSCKRCLKRIAEQNINSDAYWLDKSRWIDIAADDGGEL
jgi:hypothetical protein